MLKIYQYYIELLEVVDNVIIFDEIIESIKMLLGYYYFIMEI